MEIKNNSNIPPQPSFDHTSRICIIDKKGNVLLVNKKKNLTFPRDILNKAEDPIDITICETFEEVYIQFKKDELSCAILHSTPKKRLYRIISTTRKFIFLLYSKS